MIKRRFALYVLPTLWRAGLAFAVLPLTTKRLDPADFGLFALVLSFSSFGAGASGLGAAYPIAAHLPVLNRTERQDLVSTLLWLGALVAFVLAAMLLLVWPLLAAMIPDIANAPASASWIAAALIVLGVPWNHAVAAITVTGQAGTFAAVTIAESIASTAATLIALYGFDLGIESLFVGALVGASANTVGSVVALRHLVRFRFSRKWVADCLHVGGLSFVASLVERGQVTIERYAFAHYVGLATLGIYSHSQQYLNLAKAGAKAVSNATWPVALEEARAEDGRFTRLGAAWQPVYLALALGGVFMATLGRDAISLLTHDKFTPAYVFATLWIVLVLLENAARPAVAIVYAHRLGIANQWTVILGGLLATALMIPLIKWFGALGAVFGGFVSVLVYRTTVVVIARRASSFPFQDGTLFMGIAVVLTTLVVAVTAGHDFSARLGILIVSSLVLIVACRSARQSTVLALRTMFA